MSSDFISITLIINHVFYYARCAACAFSPRRFSTKVPVRFMAYSQYPDKIYYYIHYYLSYEPLKIGELDSNLWYSRENTFSFRIRLRGGEGLCGQVTCGSVCSQCVRRTIHVLHEANSVYSLLLTFHSTSPSQSESRSRGSV